MSEDNRSPMEKLCDPKGILRWTTARYATLAAGPFRLQQHGDAYTWSIRDSFNGFVAGGHSKLAPEIFAKVEIEHARWLMTRRGEYECAFCGSMLPHLDERPDYCTTCRKVQP